MASLGGLLVTGMGAAVSAPLAAAAPGSPGTPGDPIVLYEEDFENRAADSNVLLTDYVGASGMTYSGDPFWIDRAACNGFIINQTSPRNPADCEAITGTGAFSYNRLTAIPYALGVHAGASTPAANAAAASYTAGGTADNQIQFRTASMLDLPAANRFVTFSVDAGAMNCFATHPELRFYLLDESQTETPVSDTAIDPCADDRATVVNAPTQDGTQQAVSVGTFAADSSLLVQGGQLGIVLRNENGDGSGNDGAYDNIRVLDVTPQLDKAFSPETVEVGGVSTLTLTVTNTSELSEKNGWGFTDTLPDGLVVADPANTGGSCEADVTAEAGTSQIAVTGGRLAAEQASCTITVDVTSSTAGTYENSADSISDAIGMSAPGTTSVTFEPKKVAQLVDWKTVEASADPVVAGTTLTFTLHFENRGDADGTVDRVDNLVHVLDDADITTAPAASSDALKVTVNSGGPIAISGTLKPGQHETVTYTATVKADGERGDDQAVNYLLDPGQDPPAKPTCEPEDPNLPDCTSTDIAETPPAAGTPPDTGETLPHTGASSTLALLLATGLALLLLGALAAITVRTRRRAQAATAAEGV